MVFTLKKYWLLSTLVYFILKLIEIYVGDPYLSFSFGARIGTIDYKIVIPFGFLVLDSLNVYGLYHYAYKKHGTAWLTMNMGLCFIHIIVKVLPFWYLSDTLAKYTRDANSNFALDTLISTLCLAILINWFVASFKLRMHNKLKRKNEWLSDPECQTLLQELKDASNLDDLLQKYQDGMRKHPFIASTIKKIYKQKKLELT